MNYITTPKISYEAAARAVAIAMEVGARHGIRPAVAVAGPSMALVAYGIADDATPHSAETSTRKAQTAASTGKPSGSVPETFAVTLPLGSGGLLTSIPGGLPIAFDGVRVGGLGIAGGPPAVDHEIAIETLAQLGADEVEVGS